MGIDLKTLCVRRAPVVPPLPLQSDRRSSIAIRFLPISFRNVDIRLPGKGNSNSHGARPVYLIITMIKWIRTSRLSIKNSLSHLASWRTAVVFVNLINLASPPREHPREAEADRPATARAAYTRAPEPASLDRCGPSSLLSSLLLSSLELSDTQVYQP